MASIPIPNPPIPSVCGPPPVQTNYFTFLQASDCNPGAILRLGTYCDSETDAGNRQALATFYPASHIADTTPNELASSTGDPTASPLHYGILLSCNGRVLSKAGEKLFVESVGQMDIDIDGALTLESGGDLTMTAGGDIGIQSGAAKSITINAGAGTGNVTISAKTETTKISGKDYTRVTDSTTNVYMGNVITYHRGFSYSCSFAPSVSLNASATFAISMIGAFYFSIAMTFYYQTFYVGYYVFCIFWVKNNMSVSNSEFGVTVAKFFKTNVDVNTAAADVESNLCETTKSPLGVRTRAATADLSTVDVESSQLTTRTRAVSCTF